MESELILLCIRLLYNIQIGFAAFFVLMVFIYHFIEQNSIIARFTTQSIKIEKYAGIVYVLIFGTYALVLFTLPSESSNTDRKLLFSQYWYGFWLYPTVIGLLTLVSWFEFSGKTILLTCLSSILLLNFHTFIIFVIDYIDNPNSIYNFIPFLQLLIDIGKGLLLFVVLFACIELAKIFIVKRNKKSLH